MNSMQKARSDRTKYNFNYNHINQGGLDKLMEMVERGAKISEMADQFSVSSTRISAMLKAILGIGYTEYLIKKGLPYGKR